MINLKRLALGMAVALAAIVQPLSHAGKLTGTLPVTLTMIGACSSLSATPLDFGVHRYPTVPLT